MVTRFLDTKRQEARTEQRSVGRFATIESYAKHFRDFVGADKPITALDAVTLADYHAKQLEAIGNDEITAWTARDRLQVARQFIRAVYEFGLIDLPRNLDSRNIVISVTPGEIAPMPVKVFQERVRKAMGRLKLELLLIANCGMYQVDCADLKHSEVDWKAGTIKRKRSKTKNEQNVPVVTYYLWPTTLDLLRQHAMNDGSLVLATRNGLATVHDGINEDGKAVRTDSTAQAYARLQGRITGKHWSLKTIRKMSSSLLFNHPHYGRYSQYFLGQAPETVADAHYNRPTEEQFKECLTWLGKELGTDTPEGIGQDAAE